MKNKEIEELLNKIRNSIKTHKKLNLDDDMLVVLEFDVIQWNLLLSYIEQLENNKNEALKIIDSYDLGKYDYSIPAGGIIELRESLKGGSDEFRNN